MQSSLSTKRLHLQKIAVDDHEFIRELVNTEGWLQFIGDRSVHSKEAAIAYIEKINNTPNLTYWVVRTKETNTPVGIISFLKRSYLEHFDIGFAFLPRFQGQGYAFEAATEVLSVASKEPQYNPVLATTMPANTCSIKLLTKLGLHFEKELQVGEEKLHIYSTAINP